MSTEQHPTLLTPVQLGPYTLRNRMVMAPMTRNRAVEGNVASDVAGHLLRPARLGGADHHRGDAGLASRASAIRALRGFMRTPRSRAGAG